MTITAELLLGATKITRKALKMAGKDPNEAHAIPYIKTAIAALEDALEQANDERKAA